MSHTVVAPEILTKHPDEDLLYSMDFVDLLTLGESLSSIHAQPAADIAAADGGPTLGTGSIVGTAIQFRCSGGTAGADYRVTVEVNTSAANIRVGVGVLYLRS